MKALVKKLAMGYVIIAICILMSYNSLYSIPVLVASAMSTGIFMVFGTAYSLVVDVPLGKIMAPLFYPDRSAAITAHKAGAMMGI